MTTPEETTAQAQRLLAEAAALPSLEAVGMLADRAVAHGSRTMPSEQVRAIAREARANSKRMSELLDQLSQLLEEEPAAGNPETAGDSHGQT